MGVWQFSHLSLARKVAGPADVSTAIDHARLDLEPAIRTPLSHAPRIGVVDICADASPTSRQSDVVDSLTGSSSNTAYRVSRDGTAWAAHRGPRTMPECAERTRPHPETSSLLCSCTTRCVRHTTCFSVPPHISFSPMRPLVTSRRPPRFSATKLPPLYPASLPERFPALS